MKSVKATNKYFPITIERGAGAVTVYSANFLADEALHPFIVFCGSASGKIDDSLDGMLYGVYRLTTNQMR